MSRSIPAVMRAAFLERPGELMLRETPVPLPGPGELLVRVEAALTCGTDLKMFQRGHAKLATPTPFGHEFSGVVAATGAGTTFNAGDPIACVPTAPCGTCARCARGRENLCAQATGRMVLGAFAEYVLLPSHIVARHVFARPAHITAEHAALLEPLACVVHGASRVEWTRGNRVVILGDGPIALLFARVAVLRGADVLVIGRHAQRVAVATRFGARGDAGDARDVATRTFPDGVDIVIECVGTPQAWQLASGLAGSGGRVLLFGGCAAGTAVSFDAFRIHYEEVDHVGAFHYTPRAVAEALAMIVRGDIDAASLITHRMPLERLHDALDLVADRTALKVAVIP